MYTLARAVLLFGAYVATARLGLQLHAVGGFATLIWAPTGIAIAALVLFGRNLWPVVALAALTVNLLAGAAPLVAAGMAAGNAGEAVLACWLLRRFGVRPRLERVRDVLGLIGLAAIVSPVLSATAGTGSLWAGGQITSAQLGDTLQTWWAGDALGAMVVAPLLLTWHAGAPIRISRLGALEVGLMLIAAAIGVQLVFGLAGVHPLGKPHLVYPVLIWAALRLGPRGAATAIFALSAIAVALTAQGIGPFVESTLTESLLAQQGFIASTSVTVLLLAAAGSERNTAIRLRNDFLAIAAHELRTPASALQLQARSLERLLRRSEGPSGEVPPLEVLTGKAESISTQVNRFNALIENLLDVSRLTSDRLELAVEQVDLSQVVREVASRLEEQAARAGSPLVLVGDEAEQTGQWDRLRVDQIVSNLLVNALKYGSGRPIELILSSNEQGAVLTVKDHGIGIAPEDQARVFERFERAASPGQFGGLGLGLWIVRRLAGAMGGTISLESRPGEGSAFTLYLPRTSAPAAGGAARA